MGTYAMEAWLRAAPPTLTHDDAADGQDQPCRPMVVLTCCVCARGVVYCHPSEGAILADRVGIWRCQDCGGAS
jgi:hypothetical protein